MNIDKLKVNEENLENIKKYSTEQKKTLTGYPHIDKPWMKYYDEKKASMKLPRKTVYQFMKDGIKNNLDNIVITYNGKKENGHEFLKNIDQAAGALTYLGVEKGNRVLFLMANLPETAHTFYANSKIGAISDYMDPRPDSVNPEISSKKILTMIKNEKINYIFVFEPCYLSMIKPIEEELKNIGIEKVVLVSPNELMTKKQQMYYLDESAKLYGLKNALKKVKYMSELSKKTKLAVENSKLDIIKYSDLIEKGKNIETKECEYVENSIAAITHSSGTASTYPKTIPLKNEGINSYAFQLMRSNANTSKGDSTLHILPYFSAYGLGISHMGFSNADNMIQIPEFSPTAMGKLIKKYKPSILMGTPNWYLALPNDKALNHCDLSFIKVIGYGGDSMNNIDEEDVNMFLYSHGCREKINKGHGMSETSGGASYATGEYNIPGSMGIPMIDTIYSIVDPETKEPLKFSDDCDRITGEFIISSPAIVDEQIDGRHVVKHSLIDGIDFIYTKDIGSMDKNGVLYFLARDDRGFTRYDGFKVKPYEIEKHIKNVEVIKDCIISPYDDEEKFGKMIKADIILRDENRNDEKKEIVKKILDEAFINNSSVSTRQIPTKINFRETYPMTKNNKVDFKALEKEQINGDEYTIIINETNVSVSSIDIVEPETKKIMKKI